MKKNSILIGLATATLLSVGVIGITGNIGVSSPQTVQAAKKGYKIQLKHNAYIFNKRGKRKGRKTLKKGKTLTAYRKVKIKGKKFYKLSKGRYLKAGNIKKIGNASHKRVSVTIITNHTQVYNAKGQLTGNTLRKGLVEKTYGTAIIKGKKYYLIGGNHYIRVNNAKIISSKPTQIEPVNDDQNTNTGITEIESGKDDLTSKTENPTVDEIKQLLENSNDKSGYAVYFSDKQLAQIKNSLWEKIQKYRIENGYPAYKSNSELDDFIAKVSQSSSNMYNYAEDINSSNIEQYVPNLASQNINAIRAFDHYKYYGHYYMGAVTEFNIKDRDPEHVAIEIFNSLKNDSFYDEAILGKDDKLSFASLGLNYNWNGNHSSVGLVFIEVSGNSQKWIDYYNAN